MRKRLLEASQLNNVEIMKHEEFDYVYFIKSPDSSKIYQVNVDDYCCNCIDYLKKPVICKHLFMVMCQLYYKYNIGKDINYKFNKLCNPFEFLYIVSLYLHSYNIYEDYIKICKQYK